MFFHRTQNGDTSHSNSGGTRGYFLGGWDCKRLMFDVESLKQDSSERGQPQLFPVIVWGETHLGMDQSQNLAIRWPPPYNLFWWHSWDFHEGTPKHTIINRPIMINNDHNLVHIQNIQNIQLVSWPKIPPHDFLSRLVQGCFQDCSWKMLEDICLIFPAVPLPMMVNIYWKVPSIYGWLSHQNLHFSWGDVPLLIPFYYQRHHDSVHWWLSHTLW